MLTNGVSCSSFEYCLEWKLPMYTRRSSKLTKGSMGGSQRSPHPNDDSIHGMWEKRHSTALRKSKVTDNVVNTDEESVCDIIDIINGTHNAKRLAKEGEEVDDEGLDSSDEDRHSVSSSVASGPSVLQSSSARKGRPSQGLCSACWKLYHKAKKMKAPIIDKLLDNGEWTDGILSFLGFSGHRWIQSTNAS